MPNLSEKTRDFCSMKPTYELDLHGLVSIDLLRKSGSFCCVFFFGSFSLLFEIQLKPLVLGRVCFMLFECQEV